MAEPVTTSPCYDPWKTFFAPVGRLPVLGKVRAEIDHIRASLVNERLKIAAEVERLQVERDKVAAEVLMVEAQKLKIDAEVLALAVEREKLVAERDRIIQEGIKLEAEIVALAAHTANENQRTINDTTRATNDTNRTIGELAALADKTASECSLLDQKTQTELAQVSDTVATGTVEGIVLKQKELYAKQAEGFDRDAEQKLAKIYADTWSVRMTAEGSVSPSMAGLDEAEIRTVLDKARQGLNIAAADVPEP